MNSDPVNSLFIIATPMNWMEVSLRYADINSIKYSQFKFFSGDQTYKDKSFNLKLKLIEETENTPELTLGFRDFIGTGKFSGEYLVTSKKIGDFDFTLGLGWGSLSSDDGIENPFIDIDQNFATRERSYGKGGNFEFDSWFTGKNVSAFYGVEYVNKYSGLRFKLDYNQANPYGFDKKSNWSYGLAIPASDLLDINLFRHRGIDIGFGVSFKANYSKEIIQKNERVPDIFFNEKDIKLLKNNDEVFSGTINSLLKPFGIYTQEIFLNGNEITFIVSNAYYRNQNLASKRIVQVTKDILLSRKINKVSIIFQSANLNTNKISFPLNKFISFLRNEYSILEIKRHIEFLNFQKIEQKYSIFKGNIDFPVFSWIVSPDFKNHIGAPEAFYSGQVGVNFDASISFSKSTYLDGKISLSLYNNMDQLRLRAYSKLPKVRSDIREYLKEGSSALSRLSLTHIFEPIYLKNGLFSSAVKLGIFEEMYGGVGTGFVYRDISKPWYISGDFYWVKQRDFNQRFSFRDYETFTGHLDFVWDTPINGVRLILSGGRFLAKDSGVTVNLSKSFNSGFVLGFYATRTDISFEEFGEGSFDKGIYFSIPLDLVSKSYQKGNARFLWKNLTRDGGARLNGGVSIKSFIDNNSRNQLTRSLFGLGL